MDVVHQHERAVHFAARRGIRHDTDRHPPAGAIRAGDEPVEGRGLAFERTGQHRLGALVDPVADDIAQAHAPHLLGVSPKYCRNVRLT